MPCAASHGEPVRAGVSAAGTKGNGVPLNQPLALTRFHAWVLLIDHIQAALTAHHAAVFVALFGGFERAENFHNNTRMA